MTQILDCERGVQAATSTRDYGEDLASVPAPALRARLRDARAGLGFARPGSLVHGPMAKTVAALEAEIERRDITS